MTPEELIAECEEYLKQGETPRQRMDRDHADVLGLMRLLAREKQRTEAIVAAYDREQPFRTADMHRADCGCLRCAIDMVRDMGAKQ